MTSPRGNLAFGPHDGAVREVLELGCSGSLDLSPRDPPEGARVVTRLEDARDLNEAHVDRLGDEPISWYDFLEFQRGPQLRRPAATSEDDWFALQGRITDQIPQIEAALRGRFPDLDLNSVTETAYLIADCALIRAARGREEKFWEMVFEAVRGGGIPCGWIGRWPGGQLILFYPG